MWVWQAISDVWMWASVFKANMTFVMISIVLTSLILGFIQEIPTWLAIVGSLTMAALATACYVGFRRYVVADFDFVEYWLLTFVTSSTAIFLTSPGLEFEDNAAGSVGMGLLGFVIWPLALFSLTGMLCCRVIGLDLKKV